MSSDLCGPLCIFGLFLDEQASRGPVSYTHLDVYKRQAVASVNGIPQVFHAVLQLCERHKVYFARFNGNVLLLTQFMATFLRLNVNRMQTSVNAHYLALVT